MVCRGLYTANNRIFKEKNMDIETKRCENTIDYETEIKDMCDKHREELSYCQKQIDELRKENEILKLKWSVVEMIFTK